MPRKRLAQDKRGAKLKIERGSGTKSSEACKIRLILGRYEGSGGEDDHIRG
jgi:hypothetical protein